MNTDDASSLQVDVLLSEEPDVHSGGTSDTNYAILAVLQSLNKNMTEMGESLRSLKRKGETQTPKTAEPAKKRKFPSTGDDSDSQESDAEELLAANKRPKVVADKSNGSTCDTSAEDESDSLLDEIAQSLTDTEKTAPNVTEKLAKIVNLRWLNKLDETNLKEKADKYLRPINCDRLITPKVNPEIWGRLDRQTRGKDLRLSNLQTTLTKVGNITAKTTDMLLKARAGDGKVDVDNMVRMNTDALALLGHVSFEISQRRRDAIRPTLHKDYATLCASHVPITNFLFGDELQTQLNHIRASNKISSTASPSNSAYKRSYGKSHTPGNNQPWKPFFRQDALGQPVVQEVDYISTPLEETNRPNGPEVTSNIIATLGNTPVSEFKAILPSLLEYFQGKTKTFKAGSLAAYSHQWQEITSDPEVLVTITGQSIEFATLPIQENPLMQTKLSEVQTESVDLEIIQLLKKGVIQPCQHEAGEFISPIFTRPKKDGSFRIILNLKCFNTNVAHYHFKMDNIWSAIRLMKPGCYMASVDLKDAYYSVSICKDQWKGILYQFVCFPNGLALCPRKFTKLLKPVFSLLRQQGHISVAYIDDSWLMADNFAQCTKNVIDTISSLDKVGFVIHPEKSVLLPTQIITFLGFVLNSILMQVSLTPERAQKLKDACENLPATASPSIRDVAHVLGLMTSSFPGVMYGPLHQKFLEMDKTQALNLHKGNFDKKINLSQEAEMDLKWWVRALPAAYNLINHGDPQVTMTTDASLIGWGCCIDTVSSGGNWTPEEAQHDINYLEMLAVFLALKSFSSVVQGNHVKLLVDNTTAVSTINQMGTCHSRVNNHLSQQIWLWCIDHAVWLTKILFLSTELIM